jgi:hypothetical protein
VLEGALQLPLLDAAPLAYGRKAGLERRPRASNISRSAFRSLFGVVNSLSPSKMLFAPAMKQSACTTLHSLRTDHAQRKLGKARASIPDCCQNAPFHMRLEDIDALTWSLRLKLSRPALRRTTLRGMIMRAVAMQRTTSNALGGGWSCRQVTSMLTHPAATWIPASEPSLCQSKATAGALSSLTGRCC